MRAVVAEGPAKIKVKEVPSPSPPSADWALVRVRAAGICGSDLHVAKGRQPFLRYPRILGHEAAGEVVSGPLPEGTRVAIDPAIPCGECRACQAGRKNCCREMRVLGIHVDGAMAEFVVAPSKNLYPIGRLPFELACLAEPLSVALHACKRAKVSREDKVLILGAGTIGLCVLLVCRLRGAEAMAVDISPSKLSLARKFGAAEAVDPEKGDLAQQCAKFFGPDGPSVVFEAVGEPKVLRQAVELAGPASRVVVLGFSTRTASIPSSSIVKNELDILGSRLGHDSFKEAVGLLQSGTFEFERLITDVLPLERAEEAFEKALSERERTVKLILRP